MTRILAFDVNETLLDLSALDVHFAPIEYNDLVGSWTGRLLSTSSDGGRGKSELRRAVCRITSGRPGLSPVDGKYHRKHTASAARLGKGEKVR